MAYLDALMDQMDPQKPKGPMEGFAPGGASPAPKVGGIQAPVDPKMPIDPIQAPPSQPAKNYLEGSGAFDQTKLNDPTHNTERYQLARVQRNHDPSLGITDAFLAEANGLGIGDFYKDSGDRLGVRNARNGARWTDGVGDVITNYTGEGAKGWVPLMTGDGGEAPQGGMGQSPMAAMQSMPGLASVLDGSGADQQIAQGVQQYSEPSKYLQALLAQLGGQQ
jgi:hypothetical protein